MSVQVFARLVRRGYNSNNCDTFVKSKFIDEGKE